MVSFIATSPFQVTNFGHKRITATTNATMAVNGKVFATDFKSPTPANLAQAMLDMENAYRFGMTEGPPTNVAPVGAYELGGQTIGPGMYVDKHPWFPWNIVTEIFPTFRYKFPAAVSITTPLTLNGNCTDVFLFQVSRILPFLFSPKLFAETM